MSQYQYSNIDPVSTSGTDLATILNNIIPALLSSQSGNGRPAGASNGTLWVDTSESNLVDLYLSTSALASGDILLAEIDVSTPSIPAIVEDKGLAGGGGASGDFLEQITGINSNFLGVALGGAAVEDSGVNANSFFEKGTGSYSDADGKLPVFTGNDASTKITKSSVPLDNIIKSASPIATTNRMLKLTSGNTVGETSFADSQVAIKPTSSTSSDYSVVVDNGSGTLYRSTKTAADIGSGSPEFFYAVEQYDAGSNPDEPSGDDVFSAGSGVTGSLHKRNINLKKVDASFISFSYSSGYNGTAKYSFYIQPGTYFLEASAPAIGAEFHQLCWMTNTSTNIILNGGYAYCSSNQWWAGNRAILKGKFTVASSNYYRLVHFLNISGRSDGSNFGVHNNLSSTKVPSLTGAEAVYAEIKITKIG